MKAIAIVVDWWGPYDGFDDFNKNGPEWVDSGVKALYMSLGKGNVPHYVGQTNNPIKKRLKNHSKVDEDSKLYVGKVSSPGKPGPRDTVVPEDLRMAEYVLVFVLQPEDNCQYKVHPPDDCVVVFNRLFDPHRHGDAIHAIPPKFPVLVAYDPATLTKTLIKGTTGRTYVAG